MKPISKINLHSSSLYISVFLISILCHMPVLLLHSANYGILFFEEQTSFLLILLHSLAAVTMCFCLRHTEEQYTPSGIGILIFSLSYSLCSYTLIQPKGIGSALVFVLLPVLYYSLEHMLIRDHSFLFFLLTALCLSLDTVTTFAILFCLMFVVLFYIRSFEYHIGTSFLHYIGMCLLSLLLSGIFSFPQIASYMMQLSSPDYEGFLVDLPFSVFLSRFYPGAVSSSVYEGTSGFNVYCGMFVLLCLFAYLFQKEKYKHQRRNAFLLILILIGILELSPLRYLVELCRTADAQYLYYDFFFVFFMILLAHKGYEGLDSLSVKGTLLTASVFICLTAVMLLGSSHNIHPMSQTTILAFSVVYVLYLLFKKHIMPHIQRFLVIFIMLELICSSIAVSFQDYVPQQAACENRFPFFSKATENTDSVQSTDEAYQTFCNETAAYTVRNTLYGLEDLADQIFDYQTDPLFSGDYFEKYNEMCHAVGIQEPLFEKAEDVTFCFEESAAYGIIPEAYDIYYIYRKDGNQDRTSEIASYTCSSIDTNDYYVLFDLYDIPFHFTGDETHTGYISLPTPEDYGSRFRAVAYSMHSDVYEQIITLLNTYSPDDIQRLTPMYVYYAAICATFLGILVLLVFTFNRDKKAYIQKLLSLKKKLDHLKIRKQAALFLSENKVYLLSVAIPFCILLACAVRFDIQPFGPNTIWDGDGLQTTIPFAMDNIRSLQRGIPFSYSGSYGYLVNPTLPLYYILAPFASQSAIPCILQYTVLSLIILSSLTMVFYLTHRLSGPAADRQNMKLLIPGLMYGMNSFALFMSGYLSWYFVIALLPLIVYAFERLLYHKKWLLYVILLSFVMYCDIMTAYYACILLACLFLFMERFASVKDFFQKGIRFACCSVLSAINAMPIIGNMIFVRSDSGYKTKDSVFPSLAFHGSFLNQWKQHMIFSHTDIVTGDKNSIILYASILLLFVFFLYLFCSKIKTTDKIRRCILIFLLYFSFNEEISSYIVNGFHYQSNLPNRHVFILIFLLSVVVYDTVCHWEALSMKSILAAALAAVGFICLCQFLSDGNKATAFITSIVLVLIYLILMLLMNKKRLSAHVCTSMILFVLTSELCANTYFILSEICRPTILALGDVEAIQEYIDTRLDTQDTIYRACFPASQIVNNGLFYDVSGTDFFASNTAQSLLRLQYLIGGFSGNNYIYSTYGYCRVTNTMFGIKYILLPNYAASSIANLNEYNYIGFFNGYYIFENPDAFVPAYFAPYETADLENTLYSPIEISNMVYNYLPDSADIFTVDFLANKHSDYAEKNDENNYEYLASDGTALTTEQAAELLENMSDSSLINDLFDISVTYTPSASGDAYLYTNEYIPLGAHEKGKTVQYTLSGPRMVEYDYHACVMINEDTYQEFCDYMKDRQLTDLCFDKYSIRGTSHYTEDGYTLFAFPYSPTWKAYVDGTETEILAPLNSYMLVETPAGEHTVEIIYDRQDSFYRYLYISGGGWLITLAGVLICKFYKPKKKAE